MKLFALESNNNDQYRNIRKKQFNLHSQQKLIYRDVFRNGCDVDFKKIQYYRIVVNGVPSQFRRHVWSTLISNVYQITKEGYGKIALDVDRVIVDHEKLGEKRGEDEKENVGEVTTFAVTGGIKKSSMGGEKKSSTFSEERLSKIHNALSKLEQDLPRTFPDLPDFHNDPQYYKKLTRLLCVLVAVRSDIGYIQGMSHIGALFLIETNCQYQSFLAMATIISRSPLNDFFTFNQKKIKEVCFKIEEKVKILSSELMQYLIANQIETKMLTVNWVMTLFTRCFQVDSILNIWDILLANDLTEGILIEICAALMMVRKKEILKCENMGQVVKMLLHGRLDLVEEEWVLEHLRALPRKSK